MKNPKNVKRILLLVEVLGLLLWGTEYVQKHVFFQNTIERPATGERALEQELTVEADDKKQKITLEIQPQARSEDEIENILDTAETEVDETCLGENAAPDQIEKNLDLRDSYADGLVDASWNLVPTTLIDTDGTLQFDSIVEPTEVRGTVTLTCEDEQRILEYDWMVYPPSIDSVEGFQYELNRKIRAAEEENRGDENVVLPTEVGTKELSWTPKMEHTGLQLCLLGFVASIAIRVAEKEEIKQTKKNRQKALQQDYPNIVNWLSLYVGAGISVKQAFTMIGKKASSEHPGYEAILRCSRAIADGKSEMAAYESLSDYAPDKNYRKLSLLITHHLRKGSEDLLFQLEREAENAFEQRKTQARVAGEEASTKLLIPMMGLLGIILVVLVIPAIQGINI